jgi:hypothetical protein
MKSAYKRVKRDGKICYVKTLANGAEVHKDGDEFLAHDSAGHYLGFTADEEEAEHLAVNGYVNVPYLDYANELSLWLVWNDAVECGGCRVMQAADGTQILALPNSIYMTAKRDEHGYAVELLAEDELYSRYGSNDFDSCLEVKVIDDGKLVLK